MKQIIEYIGIDNAGNDLYKVDDPWKEFGLTIESKRYIMRTAEARNVVERDGFRYIIADIAWKGEYKTAHVADLSGIASILGKEGGSSKSDAKIAASRENGKKGGRPKTVK